MPRPSSPQDKPVFGPRTVGSIDGISFLTDHPDLLEAGLRIMACPLCVPGLVPIPALGRDAQDRAVVIEWISGNISRAIPPILDHLRWIERSLPLLRAWRLEDELPRRPATYRVFVVSGSSPRLLGRRLSEVAGDGLEFFTLRRFGIEGERDDLLMAEIHGAGVTGAGRAAEPAAPIRFHRDLTRLAEDAVLTFEEMEALAAATPSTLAGPEPFEAAGPGSPPGGGGRA